MTIKTLDWSSYRGEVPGYGDCRAVVGEYACLFPDRHVVSSISGQVGIAPLPAGENINYLRIPRNPGDGRMVGGGQRTDRVMEWQWPAGWVPVGTMFGPNGVIYGAGDVVTPITSREEYQRTAGWRYVIQHLGVLVDCESTYADKARGLYEYTDFGDVAIGQGGKPDMGAVVSFPGEPLRRLDPRPAGQQTYPFNARFMHTDRRGDLFGITIVDLGARITYFVWMTLAELRALPFVGASPAPPVEPPIPPVEPPVPTDYLGINQRVRAKYPRSNPGGHPLGADHCWYLVDLAQQTGTLLYPKDDPNSVFIPQVNRRVSLDIVGRGSMGNTYADVLRDAEGVAEAVWQVKAPADGEYLDVSDVVIPGEPGPGPGPGPEPDCEARVRELTVALGKCESLNVQMLDIIREALR